MLGREYGKIESQRTIVLRQNWNLFPQQMQPYQENLKGADLQAEIWRNALKGSPSQVTATAGVNIQTCRNIFDALNHCATA